MAKSFDSGTVLIWQVFCLKPKETKGILMTERCIVGWFYAWDIYEMLWFGVIRDDISKLEAELLYKKIIKKKNILFLG